MRLRVAKKVALAKYRLSTKHRKSTRDRAVRKTYRWAGALGKWSRSKLRQRRWWMLAVELEIAWRKAKGYIRRK